jgi:hypothetical protein
MESPNHLAAKAAEFITTDRILEDLALEERLDAMVDRAMRRLAQMKFMKQIGDYILDTTPPLDIVPALRTAGCRMLARPTMRRSLIYPPG